MGTWIDPVCGEEVEDGSTIRSEYEGTIFHFCSTDCKAEFDLAPEDYVGDLDESTDD